MSEQKNTSEDDDPVRKKLRNLPKLQAPWYLETRLQQHLRGGERAGNWFTAKPFPAFAWSLGVLLPVFIVGYYLLIVPRTPGEQIILPKSGEPVHSTEPPRSEPEKIQAPQEQPVELPDGKPGPSVSTPDVTVESGVNASRHPESSAGGEPSSGLKTRSGRPHKTSLQPVDSLSLSLADSSKGNRDSLERGK